MNPWVPCSRLREHVLGKRIPTEVYLAAADCNRSPFSNLIPHGGNSV